MSQTKDIILSLSGGLDSSSLAAEFKDRIRLAVSFKYGSNHMEQEIKAAQRVAKELNLEHRIVDLTEAFKGFRSALLSGKEAVPNAEYDVESISKLVVPFRNGIFLSVLAGLADSVNAKFIALASHSGDHFIYRDCRPVFSTAMDLAIQLGTDNEVTFFKPYNNISKKEIAVRGIKAGLNPDWTYSCYKGTEIPCGECPTCRERIEALEYAKEVLK